MLLKIEFTFPEDGYLFRKEGSLEITSKFHHLNKTISYSKENPLGSAGMEFSVVIKAERDQTSGQNVFKIVVSGGEPIIYPSNEQKDLMPPSWTVNWLIVNNKYFY